MSRHEIDIETVAEVPAVERESVWIGFHDDDRIIQLMKSTPWSDVQSITFPVDRTPDIIAALQAIYDAEGEKGR